MKQTRSLVKPWLSKTQVCNRILNQQIKVTMFEYKLWLNNHSERRLERGTWQTLMLHLRTFRIISRRSKRILIRCAKVSCSQRLSFLSGCSRLLALTRLLIPSNRVHKWASMTASSYLKTTIRRHSMAFSMMSLMPKRKQSFLTHRSSFPCQMIKLKAESKCSIKHAWIWSKAAWP